MAINPGFGGQISSDRRLRHRQLSVGANLTLGVHLPERFGVELDASLMAMPGDKDADTATGVLHQPVLWHLAISARYNLLPLKQRTLFLPYVFSGLGIAQLSARPEPALTSDGPRYRATGLLVKAGVGVDLLISHLSLGLRLTYRGAFLGRGVLSGVTTTTPPSLAPMSLHCVAMMLSFGWVF